MKIEAYIGLPGLLMLLGLFTAIPKIHSQNCLDQGYKPFNFWLGKWEVFRPGTYTLLDRNEIKKIAKAVRYWKAGQAELVSGAKASIIAIPRQTFGVSAGWIRRGKSLISKTKRTQK